MKKILVLGGFALFVSAAAFAGKGKKHCSGKNCCKSKTEKTTPKPAEAPKEATNKS